MINFDVIFAGDSSCNSWRHDSEGISNIKHTVQFRIDSRSTQSAFDDNFERAR